MRQGVKERRRRNGLRGKITRGVRCTWPYGASAGPGNKHKSWTLMMGLHEASGNGVTGVSYTYRTDCCHPTRPQLRTSWTDDTTPSGLTTDHIKPCKVRSDQIGSDHDDHLLKLCPGCMLQVLDVVDDLIAQPLNILRVWGRGWRGTGRGGGC